jgi:hypothetical protein
MKSAFFLPFVLLLGMVIGGWAPKEELRLARAETDRLTAKLAERDKTQRLDAFTRIVQIPDRATQPKPGRTPEAPARKPEPSASASGETNAASRLAASVSAPSNSVASVSEQRPEKLKPEDLRARIDEAKELWLTRVEVAHAQWVQRLKLTPEETARFDSAINAMNENLYVAMQNLASGLEATDTPSPATGMRAFNEMTGVLVQTYDELATIVPPDTQQEAAKLELSDFIDPAIAEPLVAVQDKLDSMPRGHRPGGRLLR